MPHEQMQLGAPSKPRCRLFSMHMCGISGSKSGQRHTGCWAHCTGLCPCTALHASARNSCTVSSTTAHTRALLHLQVHYMHPSKNTHVPQQITRPLLRKAHMKVIPAAIWVTPERPLGTRHASAASLSPASHTKRQRSAEVLAQGGNICLHGLSAAAFMCK